MNAGIISDIVDYQLVGGPFPVQYLYDDTLPNPEIGQVQGGGPIVAVPNTAGINAPRWVAFVQPGFDFDPNVSDTSHISDIVAMVPTAQNASSTARLVRRPYCDGGTVPSYVWA
jgi:hypothetical protein